MDIRQLRYFVTIAELGGFSEAARYLHIAQPALSRHVRALEEELGVTLLKRTAKGVCLNEDGQVLLRHASGILHQFDLLPSLVGQARERVAGPVVVGLPTSVSAVLAQPLVREVRRRFPDVRLHLIDSLSGYLEAWITEGKLDLCLLYNADRDRGLDVEDLLIEDLHIIGAAGGFPSGSGDIEFTDLPAYPLAMPGVTHSLRVLLETMALSNGIPLDIVVEVDSLPVMLALVEDERLFTLLPRGVIVQMMQAGRLDARRVVSPTISRKVSLVKSTVRPKTNATIEVRNLIVSLATELIEVGIWAGKNLKVF